MHPILDWMTVNPFLTAWLATLLAGVIVAYLLIRP